MRSAVTVKRGLDDGFFFDHAGDGEVGAVGRDRGDLGLPRRE